MIADGGSERALGVRGGSGGGLEGVIAELAQRVVRAAQQLARDGQHRAVLAEARLELQVVGVMGRAGLAGRLGGLERGPARDRRPLARQVAEAAFWSESWTVNVQAGEAYGLA